MATFHGSGTSSYRGGAWRRPERRQAHRCPSPSSCLPRHIKDGLLLSLSTLPATHTSISLALFTPLPPLPFFSPWPLIRDRICWSNDRGRKCWEAQGGVGVGVGPGLSTVLSVLPEPASSRTWPGPTVTEAGFQPRLSSWSICQTGPVTTAPATDHGGGGAAAD